MILVTGATGKVGSQLIEQLAAAGEPVRALVRDPEKAARMLPADVELARGDLDEIGAILGALDDVDRLFLLSPPLENMLQLERNVIAAATDNVEHIVKLSAIGAEDPQTKSFFPRQHGQAEIVIRDVGFTYTFLRPNFFMQNLLAAAPQIKSQGAIYQPGANQSASHIDIADIASVAAAVLRDPSRHANQAYTLTGPQSLTFHQVADIVSRVIGKPVKYIDVPRDAARQAMISGGMPEWQAEGISQLMDDYRAGKMSAVTNDVERITGKKPRTVEEFATENRSAFV